jgi:hypothetical protein
MGSTVKEDDGKNSDGNNVNYIISLIEMRI